VDKRTFVKSVLLGVAGVFASGMTIKAAKTRKKWDGIFRLPELPYSFDSLEPFIDSETMKLHYMQHHAAYTDGLNAAVNAEGLTGKTAYELLRNSSAYSDEIRNNCGGYLNHKLFWRILAPANGKGPSSDFLWAIEKDFGSFDAFRNEFSTGARSVFGSGWVWLIAENTGRLRVTSTSNHDNPLMDVTTDKGMPLLCLDVWEHAYYMKNKNRRTDYVDSFWNVVNWDVVSNRYRSAMKRNFTI